MASRPARLAALAQLNPAVLSRIKVRKYLRLGLPAESKGVRVLARWNDPAGSPAAVEKAVGRGRVLLWTVTADKGWSDWPSDPTYVLAMREAAKALVRDDAREHTLTAGEPLRRPVAATHDISEAEIEKPGAERPQPLAIEVSAPQQTPPTKTLVDADTRLAGLYRLRWQDAQAGPATDLMAVNPDVRESALSANRQRRAEQEIGGDDSGNHCGRRIGDVAGLGRRTRNLAQPGDRPDGLVGDGSLLRHLGGKAAIDGRSKA